MKWNQKGIIACVILFFVIIGALMVQGVQKTNNQEDAHYASEEDVVSVEKKETAKPELTKSVEPTKTPKQKTAVSTSTSKEKIKGEKRISGNEWNHKQSHHFRGCVVCPVLFATGTY